MDINSDVCNRCLVMRDVRIGFTARWQSGGMVFAEPWNTIGPRETINWHEKMMIKSGGDAIFDYAASRGALTAITTWNGDPVCEMHLWDLTERELRGTRI